MAYVDVSKEVKFNIFKEHLAGAKLTSLARKYHVSRASIYLWINAATKSVFESFEPDKRGPKFKKLSPESEVIKLRNQVDMLKEQLDALLQSSQNIPLSQKVQIRSIRPKRCPHCGCQTIWLHGSYKAKDKSGKTIRVYRFRCHDCRRRVYPE